MSALSRNVWDTVSSPGVVFSAGVNTNNLTAVTFSNSNGVSFGLNAGVVTASMSGGGAGGAALQGSGTFTQNTGTIQFANSNGVSFGLTAGQMTATVATNYQSQGAYLTTAMQSNAATISNVNVSAGSTSSNVSAITFSNGSGVSFGFDGSNVTATVATNYQSQGAYLTTAALSQDSSKYAGTGFTSTTTAGTALVGTLNTSGLSVGVPAFLTTAMQSNAGTISNIKVSAGTLSANRSDITFSNSNGVGFGLDTNGVITASYTVPTVTNSAWTVSDSATSATVARLAFVNTNGVSFALTTSNNGSQSVGASIATTYAGTGFTSTTTAGTAIVGTLNTSGLSLGVPAFLTTAGGAQNVVSLNGSSGQMSISGQGLNAVSNTASTIIVSARSESLNEIQNPVGDAVFSMGSNAAFFSYNVGGSFSTNATREGMFQISVAGNVTQEADVVRLWQGNGSPTTLDMLHIEAGGTNVTALRLQNSATVAAEVNNPIKFTTADTNFSIGSVPMILGTGMSNLVSNLNANYLQGSLASQFAASNVTSARAGTNTSVATTAGTDLTLGVNTSGVTIGYPKWITTYAAQTNWTVSDSATSVTVARLMFSNANGVSFGLITSNNGSQSVTASIATTYAGTGFTSTTTAGTAIVGTNNTSGLSLGIPPFLTTAAQTGQTLGFSLGGNSGTTNSSQISNGGYVLAGGNNITINQSNNSISIIGAAAGTGGGIVGISNSQILFSTGTVNLLEGGGAITIASSAGGQSLKFSVPQTSSLAGVSGIAISTSGSTISIYPATSYLTAINLSAGTASTNDSHFTFSNSNGVSFGIGTGASAGVITASVVTSAFQSYWFNIQEVQGTSSFSLQSNSLNVQPLQMPYAISCSYIRVPVSFANLTSTTLAATAGSTSFYYYQSINAVVYSQGGGGNSRSLQYVASGQAAFTEAFLFSISNAGTNESIAYQITYPVEGNNTNNSATTMLTTAGGASIFLHTTGGMTNFTGIHHLDIPFANSLSAGNYWIAFNRSTSSTTSGGGIAITNNVNRAHSFIAVTQINSNFVPLGFASAGAATASTQPVWQIGLGSHSVSAQGATTSSLALSSISSVANFPVIPMQLIRQA